MAEALGVPFRSYQKWLYTSRRPRDPEMLLERARSLCTMRRANCWEVLSCGRGPEGDRPHCPAATDLTADGINGGRNAGRVCWAIAGTFCEGLPDGAHATNLASCLGCSFFRQVLEEEGLYSFKLLKPGQTYTET